MLDLVYESYNLTDINKTGIGIENCNNSSCFFNSAIQLLFHIPELREFLIANQDHFDNLYLKNLIRIFELCCDNQVITRTTQLYNQNLGDFYRSVQQHFFMDPAQRSYDLALFEIEYDTRSEGDKVIFFNDPINKKDDRFKSRSKFERNRALLTPAELARKRQNAVVNLRNNLLHNTAQRDASELLIKLLDLIQEEIINNLYILSGKSQFTLKLLLDLKIFLPFTDLLIKKSEYTKCLDNPIDKKNYQEEYNYVLMIASSIQGLDTSGNLVYNNFDINLNDKIEISQFSGSDPNNADACKWDYRSTPRREITTINTKYFTETAPKKYLLISLNRFDIGAKLNNPVNNMNLNDDYCILDRYNNEYKLIGSICHHGSRDSGHYWYIHKYDNWKVYNDDSPIQHNTYVNGGWTDTAQPTSDLYILLFKRVKFETCIPLYNIPRINKIILNNLSMYNLNIDIEFISIYLQLLTYYSNKKNNLQLSNVELDELFKNAIYCIRDQISIKLLN